MSYHPDPIQDTHPWKLTIDHSWHARHPIPAPLLSTLHTHHPTARLHLINPFRNPHTHPDFTPNRRLWQRDSGPGETARLRALYEPPDIPALSSPQLHSLDYANYQESYSDYRGDFSERNEMALIKPALLQARNLKRLRFKASGDAYPEPTSPSWSEGRGWFDFRSGDRLPALEELVIPYEGYLLWEEKARELVGAMELRGLRRLEVPWGAPKYLLREMTGKVPGLKALRCGFGRSEMPWWRDGGHWSNGWRDDGNALRGLLEGVQGLEEVIMENEERSLFDGVWEGLLERHGGSLKKVFVRFSTDGVGWEGEDVEKLARVAPEVRDLGVTVKAAAGDRVLVSRLSCGFFAQESLLTTNISLQSEAMVNALRNFQHLRDLELTVCPDKYSEDGKCSHRLLDVDFTKDPPVVTRVEEGLIEEQTVALYKQLLADREDPSLRSVKVSFRYGRPNRFRTFLVKKRCADGSRFQVRRSSECN